MNEQETLRIMMGVSVRVARRWNIEDPCELWAWGFDGIQIAKAKWNGTDSIEDHIKCTVWRHISNKLKAQYTVSKRYVPLPYPC